MKTARSNDSFSFENLLALSRFHEFKHLFEALFSSSRKSIVLRSTSTIHHMTQIQSHVNHFHQLSYHYKCHALSATEGSKVILVFIPDKIINGHADVIIILFIVFILAITWLRMQLRINCTSKI